MDNIKTLRAASLLTLVVLPLVLLGCGGGGGGGGSSITPTPRPTSTPSATSRTLTVQLRDATNLPVDGIVAVGGVVLATSGGQITYFPVAAGSVKITVEVNGVTTSRTATVANTGPTTFVYLVSAGVTPTPGPTSTLPPPPF